MWECLPQDPVVGREKELEAMLRCTPEGLSLRAGQLREEKLLPQPTL